MKKHVLLFLGIVAIAAGSAFISYKYPPVAGVVAPSTEETALPQSDQPYTMVLFNDGSGMRDVLSQGYTFRLAEGTVSGQVCNSFNGAYTLSTDAILTAAQVAATKKLCPPDIMAVEDALFAGFASGLDMRTDGQDITLSGQGKVFVFKPSAGVSTP